MIISKRLCFVSLFAWTTLVASNLFSWPPAEALENSQAGAQTHPVNVVIILTDDQGYNSMSCTGVKNFKTPSLDRLAAQGVRCTQCYSSAPVCSPTRAALLTGNYQQRIGRHFDWVSGPLGSTDGLSSSEPTLPKMLKKRGYVTGLMGKWHLGGDPDHWPTVCGFDEFKGFAGGNLDYWQHDNHLHQPDLWDGNKPLKADGYLTDLIADWSIDFISRHKNRPFFLYVPFNATHWPYQGYQEHLRNIDRAPKGDTNKWSTGGGCMEIYHSMTERLDRGIGRILKTLDEQNLTANTLVIFFSDNGGDPPFADNKPLRGFKCELYEGGIRVPCIFRWPGRIPAGKLSNQTMITMDLTATVLAATGTPRDPHARPADGINVLPMLQGKVPAQPRRLFWLAKNPNPKQPFWRAVRDGDWKLLQINEKRALYNLRDDIAEQINLADKEPDKLAELSKYLAEWETTLPARKTSEKVRSER